MSNVIKSMSEDAKKLLLNQLDAWPLARNNYDNLSTVRTKEFDFGLFKIRVQFNPGRIQSSAAKVDAKSIQERKCFLCPANLPQEQEGLDYDNKYQILLNPFPIFPEHFTIPTYSHIDQLIRDKYTDMLDFAQLMDQYSVFYNGPKCGASAPDHAHFQAGIKGFMPIEQDVENIVKREIVSDADLSVSVLDGYLRNCFLIRSAEKEKSVLFFERLYDALEVKEGEQEPMMNIVAWYDKGVFNTVVFPRDKHRPSCFFAEGDDNMLISPASVDLGGVFITPQEKDFEKISGNDIEKILKEVCISDNEFSEIVDHLTAI